LNAAATIELTGKAYFHGCKMKPTSNESSDIAFDSYYIEEQYDAGRPFSSYDMSIDSDGS
jgi:hypothetical protein